MKDRVVVVTGASAGVGRAVVREFARQGARIGLVARGRDGLEGARREVEQLGGKALVVLADVASHEQVEAAAAKVEEAFGPIEVWINNAMVSVFSPARDMAPEEIRRVTDVTYHGSVYGTLAALKRMLPRNRGKIIQIGSALAFRGIPLQSAYCGAKHAIDGFLDSVRAELIHDKSDVQITTVNLPAINTPQFDWVKNNLASRPQPVGPTYQPEVAARAIAWAADHDRREINVTWVTLKAKFGNLLSPRLADRYVARESYDSQQSDERDLPQRPTNLWEPLKGDRGAHGRFDARAKEHSLQLWLYLHRGALLTFAGSLLATTRGREVPAELSELLCSLRQKRTKNLERGARVGGQLRDGDDAHLKRRRTIIGLSLAGAAAATVVSLYQTGILRSLPEPPLPGTKGEELAAAPEAYATFSVPDSLLAVGSFAATAILAAAGGQARSRTQKMLPLALAGKSVLDVANATRKTMDGMRRRKGFSFWSVLSAAAVVATLPLTLPEAADAIRKK